jgi:hypothetical protein
MARPVKIGWAIGISGLCYFNNPQLKRKETEMKLNVLSIDWDYFFPCIDYFDWGHCESRHFMVFAEMLWQVRAAHKAKHDAFKNREAFSEDVTIYDYLQLDRKRLENFIAAGPVGMRIIACESHQDLYNIFQDSLDELSIYNFDAHHDAGYGEENGEVNCGNWALRLHEKNILTDYHVIYPGYRKYTEETGKVPDWANVHIEDMQCLPDVFMYIFICRSSAWTPPWADKDWLKFIRRIRRVNRDSTFHKVEYVMESREFDYQESINNYNEMRKGMISHGMGTV